MAACEMVLGQPAHAINDGMMEHRATAAAAAYAPKPPRRECEKPPSPEAKAATCDQFLWIVDRKYSPIPQDKWPQAFAGGLMDPNSAWALQSMVNGDRLSGEQNCELKSMMTDLNAVGELAQKTGVRSPLIDSALAELAIKTMQSDDKMWEAKMRLLSSSNSPTLPRRGADCIQNFAGDWHDVGARNLGAGRGSGTRVGRLEWRRRPGCREHRCRSDRSRCVRAGVTAVEVAPTLAVAYKYLFPIVKRAAPFVLGSGEWKLRSTRQWRPRATGVHSCPKKPFLVQQLDPQIWQSVAATSDFQNAYRESIAKNFGAWFMKECELRK